MHAVQPTVATTSSCRISVPAAMARLMTDNTRPLLGRGSCQRPTAAEHHPLWDLSLTGLGGGDQLETAADMAGHPKSQTFRYHRRCGASPYGACGLWSVACGLLQLKQTCVEAVAMTATSPLHTDMLDKRAKHPWTRSVVAQATLCARLAHHRRRGATQQVRR